MSQAESPNQTLTTNLRPALAFNTGRKPAAPFTIQLAVGRPSLSFAFGMKVFLPTVADTLAATVLLVLWGAMGSVVCFLLWCVLLDLAPNMFHPMSHSLLSFALLAGRPFDPELERSAQCLGAVFIGFVSGGLFRYHGLRKQRGRT